MAIEIEIKMKLDDPGPVLETLRRLGGRRTRVVREVNHFFDTADAALRRADKGVRIRVETPAEGEAAVIMTFKGPREAGDVKQRPEHEVRVSDADAAGAILEGVGLIRTLSFEKLRESWAYGGCKVELDTLPHLGRFIEIEGPDEAAVLAVRDALGLGGREMITTGYASMLAGVREAEGLSDYLALEGSGA